MTDSQDSELVDIKSYYTSATAPSSELKRVPRNFFQTYKTSLFDRAHARRLVAFRVAHPEFNFYFYDDDAMDSYMSAHWADHPIHEVYRNVAYGPTKADIWRYCILFQYGGVYLDVDSEIMFNMNTIPPQANEMIAFEGSSMRGFFLDTDWPFHDFIAATDFREPRMQLPDNEVLQWMLVFRAGHPILRRAIELIVQNAPFFRNKVFPSVMHAVMAFAGPPLFTQAVWEYRRTIEDLQQFGLDFNGQARFKSIENPQHSVYAADPNYYARKRNEQVFKDFVRLRVVADEHMPGADAWSTAGPAPASRIMPVHQLATLAGVDDIDLADLLERLPLDRAEAVVSACCAALRPQGLLHLQFICLDAAMQARMAGRIDLTVLNRQIFDGPDAVVRRSLLSVSALRSLLTQQQMDLVSAKSDDGDCVVLPPQGDGLRFRLRAKKRA